MKDARKQRRKCLICEQENLEKVEDITLEISGYVFIVKGERCTSCREEFPYQEETERTISVARKLGVWPEPLKLYRHLSKSGSGLEPIPLDTFRAFSIFEILVGMSRGSDIPLGAAPLSLSMTLSNGFRPDDAKRPTGIGS